jgi:hypothetical protein
LDARRRHDRTAHQWGIVAGLTLTPTPTTVRIEPGVAVDGYGRPLVLQAPIAIALARLDHIRAGAAAVDVWLLYDQTRTTPRQPGHHECGPGRESRWLERPRKHLTTVSDAQAPACPRQPPGVTPDDLPLEPQREGREDRRWPVYLGRLTPQAGGMYSADPSERPQAGLVGETVTAPDGATRVQVGSERPGDRARFAVTLALDEESPTTALAIDRQGALALSGATRLRGDLLLANQARLERRTESGPCADHEPISASASTVRRASFLVFRPLTEPPAAPSPWQLYRAKTKEPAADELRIELGDPGAKGNPAAHRLGIGSIDGGVFEPCLSVAADCSVAVGAGKLVLNGQLVLAPAEADPADPRFAAAVIAQWLDGIARAGVKLDALYAGALTVAIGGVQPAGSGGTLRYTVTVRNTGPAQVRDIEVTDITILDGAGAGGGPVLHLATLDPDTARSASRSVPIPPNSAGKSMRLTANASGSGPPGYPIAASASRDVPITS